jgi:hypothetical protein
VERSSFRSSGSSLPSLSKCVDINTPMTVKTVTLTEDAYNALAALKNEGESFSQLVTRLAGSRTLLSAFAGAWLSAPPGAVDGVRRYLDKADRASRSKMVRLDRNVRSDGEPR